ncbi:beta-ketoacyl-ACP synthase II [Nocardia brasiliensis]|uniref:3-oxoacyl-[acyl-carrier-protein] synthase 2 n=1 Tax=Nocardia brasiliensis (strain ATCC 700358 / HUJEG-1) TaxID=1133849 RepID=K0EWT8_NOCB7|nr:beta-ketoacyl-ACP synthase II [Nocardia brasiliensis]AFU00086.1 3-oxoacyl-[acyl-carrier-protein] synthase II [Nocardia brasiliensis ATCC 700358]OCF86277.1 hypothetical protein AW168_31385 [Nocardia brasiliensis]
MTDRRRVVVTGIGLVTPLGIGTDTVWKACLAGQSGIGPISGIDVTDLPVRIAGQVAGFDAADWLDPKERRLYDRFSQLGIAAAQLALDDAAPGALPQRVATIIASGEGGIASLSTGVSAAQISPQHVSPTLLPAIVPNACASAVARRYRFDGPSYSPTTACSSGADAVGQGFQLVADGYTDMCVAGGTEAPIARWFLAGFANMRALSRRNDDPARASRPFTLHRDGFVLAEGAAILVLEDLDSAIARHATIHAEVRGYAAGTDHHHLTAPDPTGAAAALTISRALRDADLTPPEVGYINAHGTSTRLNDAAETLAIKTAFGAHAHSVAISSTKSMTGHMLGATGAVEAALCCLACRHQTVPPTINYNDPDPACDLDYTPNVARRLPINVAMSTSLAFGGHNATLVVRRYPESADT